MTLPKISANRILIIVLLIVVVVGYYMFRGSGEESLTTTSTSAGPPTVGQELVIELNRLKALKNINNEIFSDPVFGSLVDFSRPISPQPLGRSNPFAPIGSN